MTTTKEKKKKVAFVSPRYGTEIMGGAETAVRRLAEHLCAQTQWEAEVHTTAALDAITWNDELEPTAIQPPKAARWTSTCSTACCVWLPV